jgi:hypothetical protein
MRFLLLAAALVVAPTFASAHPGGLAADGCHNDRQHGGRHCHRPPASMQTSRPQGFANRPATGRTYANCAEARAAGAAPVRRGQPGYGPHLDRDNDGVGCE